MSGPGGVAGDQLRAFVEGIEHVEEEIKALTEDKKDIYAEAKGQGFDVKILRQLTGFERRTRRSEMRRRLCSTSTFRHWRPPRHQSRRRRDQSGHGVWATFPFCTRPAIADCRSCLRSLDVSYSGAPTSGSNRPLVTYRLGGISLTAPGQMP
jgi:uncharacterized protein (UPF0335 family)